MLRRLAQFYADHAPFPASAIAYAKAATVKIYTTDEPVENAYAGTGFETAGTAVGVVTGPHTILTAAHVLLKSDLKTRREPRELRMYHLGGYGVPTACEIEVFPEAELGAIRVSSPLTPPYAPVDHCTPLGTAQFSHVAMCHFKIMPEKQHDITPRKNKHVRLVYIFAQLQHDMMISKGLLYKPSMKWGLKPPMDGYDGSGSQFFLRSQEGHSGSGIFTKKGKVLSILSSTTADYKESIGVEIEKTACTG